MEVLIAVTLVLLISSWKLPSKGDFQWRGVHTKLCGNRSDNA